MTRNEALDELDQLIAEAKHESCFGESDTVIMLRAAYVTGCREAEMFDQNTPTDQQEYEAAHAGQMAREASAINKEYGR